MLLMLAKFKFKLKHNSCIPSTSRVGWPGCWTRKVYRWSEVRKGPLTWHQSPPHYVTDSKHTSKYSSMVGLYFEALYKISRIYALDSVYPTNTPHPQTNYLSLCAEESQNGAPPTHPATRSMVGTWRSYVWWWALYLAIFTYRFWQNMSSCCDIIHVRTFIDMAFCPTWI